jgi:hypothetical protein
MKETISIIENGISVDNEKLKNIIIAEWQSGSLFRFYYNQKRPRKEFFWYILDDLSDLADNIYNEVETNAQKLLNLPNATLDICATYESSDKRSIGFRVLIFLQDAWIKSSGTMNADDIRVILEFLDTKPDKLVESWNHWRNYWGIKKFEGIITYRDIPGSIHDSIEIMNEYQKEFESRKLINIVTLPTKDGGDRIVYYYEEGSLLQFKANSKLQYIKIIIFDMQKKNKEKITFILPTQ